MMSASRHVCVCDFARSHAGKKAEAGPDGRSGVEREPTDRPVPLAVTR